jgi:hypothetical protein
MGFLSAVLLMALAMLAMLLSMLWMEISMRRRRREYIHSMTSIITGENRRLLEQLASPNK